MYELWNSTVPFPNVEEIAPFPNLRFSEVHRAEKEGYQFLLGSAVVRHQGTLYCSWANSFRIENEPRTMLAQKRSEDDGITWKDYCVAAAEEPPFGRSHAVYFQYRDALWLFCPRARFQERSYPDLVMEGYRLNGRQWEPLGTVLDQPFWPLCEPILLENGTVLLAGLETETAQGAVALCRNEDLSRWEMKVLPNPNQISYWGETTVLKLQDRLLAIARCGKTFSCALVSESLDNGKSWSALQESNFPIAYSKLYAGTLQNGEHYLLFNPHGDRFRDPLCIAFGKERFDRVYTIRRGFDAPPRFQKKNEWSYPYAYEEDSKLYIVYAKNKEDCELAVLDLRENH